MQEQMLILARLCEKEPMPGFGPGILCQELCYSATSLCGKLSVELRRRVFRCVCVLGVGETLHAAIFSLGLVSAATPLWVET